MYYVSSNGMKTAVIVPDYDAESPREPGYQDNITHMICWHSKYSLGDEHAYESPTDFAFELSKNYASASDVASGIEKGIFDGLRLTGFGEVYHAEMWLGEDAGWKDTGFRFTKDFNLVGDCEAEAKEELLSAGYIADLISFCNTLDNVKLLPLFLYDHSGLSMSTGSFIGRAPHAEWDSGRVGFIYMDKETAMKNLENVTEENWKDAADKILRADVKEYDNYLTGEIYGYQLYDGLTEVDSCWGFNPGEEDITKIMKTELSGWVNPEMDFEQCWEHHFDIDGFYEQHEFPEFRLHLQEEVESVIRFHQQLSEIFPFGMSAEMLLSNTDGILDDIVSSLYEEHEEPDRHRIYEAIYEYAGVSRDVQPKIKVSDLEENRDYTAEEIMEIIHRKPSLKDMIAGAEAKCTAPALDGRRFLQQERE